MNHITKPLNWKDGEITILKTEPGLLIPNYQRVTIFAEVCGPLAINVGGGWTSLTHVPTGTRLWSYEEDTAEGELATKEKAEELAQLLPLDDPRWQATDKPGLITLAHIIRPLLREGRVE